MKTVIFTSEVFVSVDMSFTQDYYNCLW